VKSSACHPAYHAHATLPVPSILALAVVELALVPVPVPVYDPELLLLACLAIGSERLELRERGHGLACALALTNASLESKKSSRVIAMNEDKCMILAIGPSRRIHRLTGSAIRNEQTSKMVVVQVKKQHRR
jgi:hypothetical protein